MKIVNLNKDGLNSFVADIPHSPFQQSWEWGEFQRAAGFEVVRLGLEDDGRLVAVATLIKKSLGLGMAYWYSPKGPVFKVRSEKSEVTSKIEYFLQQIKIESNQRGVIFLRFEPIFKIQNSKFKIHRTIDVQPSRTSILDLNRSEDELLTSMHPKTRYNIRLAEKKGVQITKAGPERFDEFWGLMEQTKTRDEFRLHDKEYYRKMVAAGRTNEEAGTSDHDIELYFAEFNHKVLASNIISFFGDTVTYVHGASSNEERNVMAPYLLQWQIIRKARDAGFKYYDFYGIDEGKWPGVTRFKRGFGGEEVSAPGTYDIIFNAAKYSLYKCIRKIRRWL